MSPLPVFVSLLLAATRVCPCAAFLLPLCPAAYCLSLSRCLLPLPLSPASHQHARQQWCTLIVNTHTHTQTLTRFDQILSLNFTILNCAAQVNVNLMLAAMCQLK